ncbi:hypothetical protein [Enterococcus plantarum]|uniref:hypothetical protein n=1 Tax=Enterococcus plantarum TaxID=1077675 RepID=UPI001A907C2E|nr:hypothetical protein [Enterococcus plantarum]MBO0424077.1 hypothetical protein [Enterococcus plantarum]
MIKSVVEQVKEVKKLTEDTVNIPLTYLIFLSSCFLLWKPKYISLVNVFRWIPNNIREIILGLFNVLYSNIILVFIALFGAVVVITLLSEYTSILDKLLPDEVEYMDNTEVSWNQYSAIRRLVSIVFTLALPIFVYYFTTNVLLNQNNFVETFFQKILFR